ncbi:MAG: YlxR family protein [Thermomicrobiales bacterium]|nr:YlxR family protein [Thermomicrobiales bacterium]
MPTAGTTKKNAKAPRQKHVPQRTCVVCRETNAKRTLTRIVRTGETSFEVDPTGRANGRGAYLCSQFSCWQKAATTPILAKALRVTPDETSIQNLQEFAANLPQNDEAEAAAERS